MISIHNRSQVNPQTMRSIADQIKGIVLYVV